MKRKDDHPERSRKSQFPSYRDPDKSGTPGISFIIVLIFVLVTIDRVTAGAAMVLGTGSCNPGVAFGLLPGVPGWIWSGLSFLAVTAAGLWILRGTVPGDMRWGVYISYAGAVSNFLSRVLYGCVWDWIGIGPLKINFTLADIYIDIGLFLVLLGVFLSLRDNEER